MSEQVTEHRAIAPMLAKRVDALPAGGAWFFEPKWDGFRVLVFRDGDDLLLQSRDLKPLDRYFPELRAPLLAQLPARCVLDGEIVIAKRSPAGKLALDFDSLTLRVHPAASRVRLLAEGLPASIVFFDLLSLHGNSMLNTAFATRRKALEEVLKQAAVPLHLTPPHGRPGAGRPLVRELRRCRARWSDGEGR